MPEATSLIEPDPLDTRSRAALRDAVRQLEPVDPFAGAAELIREWLGEPVRSAELFASWGNRSRGNPTGEMRYRWELSHRRGVRVPPHSAVPEAWRAWRSAEQPVLQKDPFAFEERLSVPIALASNCELLARSTDPLGAELLAEAMPIMRRDFALAAQGLRPWADTFSLWCLVRSPSTLRLLQPFAIATAAAYAASATDGSVRDLRFPFHDRPLASASAHLAHALLVLGIDVDLTARLCLTVANGQGVTGAWGDAGGEPDVLTTLACADLMACVDTLFDPEPTRRWLLGQQGNGQPGNGQPGNGLWTALGPEAPWLTWQILQWLDRSRRSFSERFAWPFLPEANRDRKTGLPFFAYFADLAQLLAALPGLSCARTELVFFDLIGFRAFNNQQGQRYGDEVLSWFATLIEQVPGARAIRDGGDEFLLLGAPTRQGLATELLTSRQTWPERFRARFGASVPMVHARALVGSVGGGHLLAARDRLGREVAALKLLPSDDVGGPLIDLGPLD